MPNVQLRNTLLLMGASFIWGTAFVAQSVGADHMGPYSFLAGRSWLACVFLLGLMAVLRKAGKTNSAAEPGFWQNRKVLVKGGTCCGIALFAASAAQQMGIGTTSTAKAGFMTALYVVLVPVFGVLFGRRPGVKLWCCVAASVVGLYLLCLAGHRHAPKFKSRPNRAHPLFKGFIAASLKYQNEHTPTDHPASIGE